MGYIIRRDFWGQGLTAEACRAALGYGFDVLGLDRVELWIDTTNYASQRVAQKLNFRVKGAFR
jgi:ribosomal-protein-alanine N-acetyltransferase